MRLPDDAFLRNLLRLPRAGVIVAAGQAFPVRESIHGRVAVLRQRSPKARPEPELFVSLETAACLGSLRGTIYFDAAVACLRWGFRQGVLAERRRR